ncbi:NYN domain-containing protein [Candidatus Pacearchaeota archaeon]|nr:NYN domain-containing protein [Candidatus Pacearchaeota archaeon]
MIIGLTGRIAAGKETLTQFLRDKGFVYLESSKPLKDELVKRDKEITRANMQDLGDELRRKYGAGAIMKLLLEIADKDKTKNYIFDSLRNAGEADFLRKNVKDFFLIGVDAPQRLRFERIVSRGKPSDPKILEEFLEVDNRDFFDEKNPLGQQVGKVMEKADFIIMNDGDLEKSMKRIKEIWREIEKKMNKIERVSIFVDGRNFYHSTKKFKKQNFDIKFQDIVQDLVGNRQLIHVYYYNALLDKEQNSETYRIHNEFLDILKKIPKFKIILCDVRKTKKENGDFSYEVKGDDIYLAHDLLIGAFDNLYDIAIIISGDADFIPVINTLRKRFKKLVGNGFFRRTSSYKLRQSCDFSINLSKIIKKLNKKNQ